MPRIPVSARSRNVKFGLSGRFGENDVIPRVPNYVVDNTPEPYPLGGGTTYVFGTGYWKGRWYLGGWASNYSYVYHTTNPWYGGWTQVTGSPTQAIGETYIRKFVGNSSRLINYRTSGSYPAELKIGVSTDGTTFSWYVGKTIYSLDCNDSIFVGGGNGSIYYTVDGETWTTVAAAGLWRCVGWSTTYQKFYAISTTGLIRTSTDGMTWSAAVQGPSTAAFYCIWEHNGLILASGMNCLMKSENGTDWTALTPFNTSATLQTSTIMYVAGQGLWYATDISSNAAGIFYSRDGVSWTGLTSYARGKYSACTDGNNYLVGLYGGTTTATNIYIAKSQKTNQPQPPLAGLEALGYRAFNTKVPGLHLTGDFRLGDAGTGDFTLSLDCGGMFTSGGQLFLYARGATTAEQMRLSFIDNSGYSGGTCIFRFEVWTGNVNVFNMASALFKYYWTGPKKFRLTRSGTTFSMYVNGALETTATSSAVMPTCTNLYSWYSGTTSQGATAPLNYYWNNLVIDNKVRIPRNGLDIM
jgi:hypothetical protein